MLCNDQRSRIKDPLSGKTSDCGMAAKDNRKFLETVLWITWTEAPWRDLPEFFGNGHRSMSAIIAGAIKESGDIFEALSKDKNLEYLMVDNSIARVHQ
ncbi:hypothetical protein CI610_01179 [invertebrate metagenome]|uniref:Transposase n=1 Tax=invertebrate metagenome TaxID=1711999 RepID=A0A2H9T9D4_9ZZZZ